MKFKKLFTKKNIFLFIAFVLLCLLFYFIPLTGDDWQNYGNGRYGFINILRNSYRYYLNWEGRIGSRIIIFSVTYNKWLWNIIASLSVIFMIFFSSKLINSKQKNITSSLFICLLFLINYDMFVQCFFWIAGHVTYTICTVLFILYIYYLFKKIEHDRSFNLFEKIFFSFFNIGLCTFVENIAVGVIVFNLLIFIYSFFIRKKREIFYIVGVFASIIGLVIQVFSPGTAIRMSLEMGEFGNLSFLQKIIYNLNNFVKYEFIINPIMVLIMIVAISLLIYKREKNFIKKVILLLFMTIIPILTIVGNINLIFPFEFYILNYLSKSLSFISNYNNILIVIYWILFAIIYFICLFIYLKRDNIKTKLIILYMVSQSCILAMLVTPTWSNRIALTTVILNYIISLIIINALKISYNKMFKKSIYSFCIVYFGLLFILYYNVNRCIQYRDDYIVEQYKKGERTINYYMVPDRLLWSQYPYSNAYRNAFNTNLGLKEDVLYLEKEVDWKYKIFFDDKVIK